MSKAIPRTSIVFKILAFIILLLSIWIIYSAYTSPVEIIHKYFAYLVGILLLLPSLAIIFMNIEES